MSLFDMLVFLELEQTSCSCWLHAAYFLCKGMIPIKLDHLKVLK